MSNRASAITVTLFSLLLIGGVVVFAVYSSNKPSSQQRATSNVTGTGNGSSVSLGNPSGSAQSSSGSSLLNVTSSANAPLGGLPGDSGAAQNQQASPTSGSTGGNKSNANSKPVINPATFGEYEKYKDQKGALFGDIAVGSGTEVTKGTKVAVTYQGWLTNGKIFDQNTDKTKPFTFTVGEGKVIPGFEEGVLGMKLGGERLVIIPPASGYGAVAQGAIPANSVLVFHITIVGAL